MVHDTYIAFMTRGPDKQFDRAVALRKAMELFWSQGYEATGVADLLDHMSIGRQSMYDTFGNKRSLFLAALRAYFEEQSRLIITQLRAPGSPLENMRAVFTRWEQMLAEIGPYGCLMGNTAVELGPHDAEVAEIVRSGFTGVRDVIAETIQRGQEAGEIRAGLDPQQLASVIIVATQGSALFTKIEKEMQTAKAALSGILELLKER